MYASTFILAVTLANSVLGNISFGTSEKLLAGSGVEIEPDSPGRGLQTVGNETVIRLGDAVGNLDTVDDDDTTHGQTTKEEKKVENTKGSDTHDRQTANGESVKSSWAKDESTESVMLAILRKYW